MSFKLYGWDVCAVCVYWANKEIEDLSERRMGNSPPRRSNVWFVYPSVIGGWQPSKLLRRVVNTSSTRKTQRWDLDGLSSVNVSDGRILHFAFRGQGRSRYMREAGSNYRSMRGKLFSYQSLRLSVEWYRDFKSQNTREGKYRASRRNVRVIRMLFVGWQAGLNSFVP